MKEMTGPLRGTFALALIAIIALIAAPGGCGKGSDRSRSSGPDIEKVAKEYQGIYQVVKMTRSKGSCKAEGASILEKKDEKYFVAFLTDTLVGKGLSVFSCKDPADCKEKTSGKKAASFIYLFTEAKGKGIAGVETFTGFSRDGRCKNARDAALTLEKEGQEKVVLRVRAVTLSYPAPKDRMCSTKITRKLAKGKPCNEYTVIHARRVGPLPR